MARRPVVAVIGGGIAGLSAAYQLTGGADGPDASTPDVVLLESDERFGGKLRSGTIDGQPVDLAADGFLGRRPEAADLCREIGLGEALVPIGASGASVWARGRSRPLPIGLVLGVPTRFWPTARSGILGMAGVARLAVDRIAPRPDRRGPIGDRSVGPLVRRKLGNRVADRLVDPLVGGIHAGSISDVSTAAVFPLLLAVAQRRGSLMRALGRASRLAERKAPEGPAFWALHDGIESLPQRLVSVLTERRVTLQRGTPVHALERRVAPERSWIVHTAGGDVIADGVVLAVPAPAAAALLEPIEHEVAVVLGALEYASVAVVTFSFTEGAVPEYLHGTGLLVPATTGALIDDGEAPLVTACTFLARKWPHLKRPGTELLRVSVGRFGDQRIDSLDDAVLAARVAVEVAKLVGVTEKPVASVVTRWHDCLPQYRVHHLLRVSAVEAALRRHPALAVAGAAYRGVGIPACIASGRAAAHVVMAALTEPDPTAKTSDAAAAAPIPPISGPAPPANGTGPPR